MTSKTRLDPNKKTLQDGIPEEAAPKDHASVRAAQRATNNNDTSDSKPEPKDHLVDGAPNNPKPDKKPRQEGDNPKDLDKPEEKWDDETPEK